MPEGPEVATLVYYLNKKIAGNTLLSINIISGKYTKQKSKSTTIEKFKEFQKALPLKIKEIKCFGKFIYWIFSNNWFCFMTLGLTGRVLIDSDSDYKRVEMITNKHNINYSDMRNFGTIHFCNDPICLETKIHKKLGVDLLNEYNLKSNLEFIEKKLKRIKNQDKEIGNVLLEQTIFAGVGNYIRAEALYLSKMSPFTPIKKLDEKKLKTLVENLHRVMKKSYDSQIMCLKSLIYNYENLVSCYKFLVYRKKETPKGEVVAHKKMSFGNRMIWYVPEVQK